MQRVLADVAEAIAQQVILFIYGRWATAEVRPVDGIFQAVLVPELGHVTDPAIVGIGLNINLIISPLRSAPQPLNELREFLFQIVPGAIDGKVIVEPLELPAFQDGYDRYGFPIVFEC